MMISSIIWMITAIVIAKDELFSKDEDFWIRKRAAMLGVIFTFIVIIIGFFGVSLTDHRKPPACLVGMYAAMLFCIVFIPFIAMTGSLGILKHASKVNPRMFCAAVRDVNLPG